MNRLVIHALLATTLFAQADVFGAIWTESGDAGDYLMIAQQTGGTGPLTAIVGTLPADSDVDVYLINIPNPATFSAWRNGTMFGMPLS